MSLSLSYDIGRSSLATTAERSAVVSRNVAGVGDPNATRKDALVVTSYGGGVRVNGIGRVSNAALFDNLVSATSNYSAKTAEMSGLDIVESVMGGIELGRSPTALLGELRDELQFFSSAPNDIIRAQSAVAAAKDLATQLNTLSTSIAQVRQDADAQLEQSVSDLNSLLVTFEEVNNAIIRGTQFNEDVTDYLDQRDSLLLAISEEVEIRTVTRSNNDIVIFAAGGATLFERTPRTVEMVPSPVLPAGTDGGAVYIDGMPITGPDATAPAQSGRIAGLATLRDDTLPTFQAQLDEVARSLVEAFAESDQSAIPALPDVPGLFTYAGATGVPPAGTLVDGLAAIIEVNANVDPAQGGDPFLLRDGAISDPLNPAYSYNTAGEAGFTGRINELMDNFSAPATFDAAAGLETNASLLEFTSSSEGWFQKVRSDVSDEREYTTIVVEKSREVLSSNVGVNLDEEMTKLLDLERSYQASSRLLQVVDQMYDAILAATS